MSEGSQVVQMFSLIPNTEKVGALRVLRFIGLVILPLCLTHFLFGEVFELSKGQYVLAQVPVLALLLNLYYFLNRRLKVPQSLQLWLEMDELCLKAGDKLLHCQKLEELSFQQLGWGLEAEDLLPAVRIQGTHFPKLIIGSTASTTPWTNVRQSVEFTDYWLHPGDSWEKFKSLLQF